MGAFIPNTGKDGEIDSFLKIRKYLADSTVDRVILADPYFSVSAAEKLLTRIPRTNLQLDIITCLGLTDPDTGKASDICKEYAYDKWHYAYIRAKWQLFLLAKYAQLHPGAEKTLKWLKEWRTRLPNIANEESGTNLTGS